MTAAIQNNGGSQFDIIIGGVVVATIDSNGIVRGAGMRLRQYQHTPNGAVATGATIMPQDNTIPQITEGDQYMLTPAITPKKTTNLFEIDVVLHFTINAVSGASVALFRDAVANALGAMTTTVRQGGDMQTLAFKVWTTAGALTPTVFRVRAGPGNASTMTVNGSAGVQYLGGVMASSITVKEWELEV
jgi:hypothetical protein